jgi:hypothetical protein
MKKRVKRNRMIGIVLGLLVFTMLLYIFFFNPQRTFNITESYRINSAHGADTFLRVVLPISGGYQEISSLLIEGAVDHEIDYFDGWQELTARVPSNGYEAIITISYTAKLFRNAGTWDGEVRPEYTLPQQFVDSDNHSIITLLMPSFDVGDNDFILADYFS